MSSESDLFLNVKKTKILVVDKYRTDQVLKADEKRVNAFEMWCYRRILRVSWTEGRTKNWVLEKLGCEMTLRRTIMKQKLRFFGYVMHRDGLERTIITSKVNGRRKRGRPSTSWLKYIAATGLPLNSSVHGVKKVASHRDDHSIA
uniref:Reverse transcriptase domain-containing protein n=1 Tax=Octopus bimaculoides TaxID=37653 RepID=A0A0L8GBP3_OCTBM